MHGLRLGAGPSCLPTHPAGIDFQHPQLAASMLPEVGWNSLDPALPPLDKLGHGTHVAGGQAHWCCTSLAHYQPLPHALHSACLGATACRVEACWNCCVAQASWFPPATTTSRWLA